MTLQTPAKLRSKHLNRQAFIYVRQSTLLQVHEHTASASSIRSKSTPVSRPSAARAAIGIGCWRSAR
jgi:hypothetical protein